MGEIFRKKPLRRTLKDVYKDINDAIDTIQAGEVTDGSITNAKLATDVKVGSLAAFDTTEKGSVQGAVNEVVGELGDKYEKPELGIPKSDLVQAVQNSLALADSALQEITIQTKTPVNAVAASKALTISGVVIDGETVTIGADIYEFAADVAQSVGAGNIAADITAVSTAAQGVLTVSVQPTAGDTILLDAKTYTFVPDGTANGDGEISRGTNLATAKANIVAAIKGTDGHNDPHPSVDCDAEFTVNDLTITALVGGVAGNSIDSVYTGDTNAFDAATLGAETAGVDCTAENGAIALVAASAGGAEAVTLTRETAVVTATADVKGAAGNSIALAEDMANGAWAAAADSLSGGVDGTVGEQWELAVDASYLYVAVAENTIADNNWRRISLGSAY